MEGGNVLDGARGRMNTRQAILLAARDLLADSGVRELTIEGVADRSGVAKTTIYRRFRSKHDLALAVVLEMTHEVVATEREGDVRDHLIGLVDTAVALLRTTIMGRVMQGLASDIATDPDLSREFKDHVVELRTRRVGEIVQFGIERGELRPDTDPAFLQDLLFGPVYHRLLLSGEPLGADLGERIVDAVLPAFVIAS
jgi:AcrR family transcriptional regulator